MPATIEMLPTPAPTPAAPVAEALSQVDLATFCTVAGVKWDQLAGFRSYAQRAGLAPRTIPEWRSTFQNFMGRPC